MKFFYLCVFLFLNVTVSAQNPLIVKAVGGSALEPDDKDQEIWQNNEWNGKFFYQGTGTPLKLCVTDGTTAGTALVKDINANYFQYTFPAQNFIYIVTERSAGAYPNLLNYVELWKSDGTADGTLLVKAFDAFNPFNFSIGGLGWTSDKQLKRNFSVVGDVMYFRGYDVTHGAELWRTDGTTAGTFMVKDLKPGTASTVMGSFCAIGSDVFFNAAATGFEQKLWKTDGTAAGTVQVAVPEPFFMTPYVGKLGNKMIFYANNTVNGLEPWVSDGTPAGTYMLADINPGSAGSNPGTEQNVHLRFNNKYAFFIANKTSGGKSLWRTDGTSAGTIQLTADGLITEDNFSGGGYSDINNNILYWIGGNQKLYKSDGTPGGTGRVTSTLSNALYLKIYKDAAWFHARNADNVSNGEPYRSDGTAANTARFDVQPGQTPSYPYGFFVTNNKLYFFSDSYAGKNLYQYNGDMTFNGSVPGRRWRDSANWNSAMPPGLTDTAYIGTGLTVNVDGAKAYAGRLVMNSGSSVNIVAATDSLFVHQELSGALATGSGVLVLKNFSGDTVRLSSLLTAPNMNVQGFVATGANLTVTNRLHLTSNARLLASQHNIVLSGTSATVVADAGNYIVTDGTGSLVIENIGPGGRAGNVVFPVGTATHFNPVTLANSGTDDHFRVRVQPGISSGYTGETPAGAAYSANAVNATWFINEGTPGGSNATIGLQWTAAQELPGFNRLQNRLGHYTSGAWQLGPAGAATGADPYSWTGTGYTSFSPFGIMSSNAVLPVRSVQLSVTKTGGVNRCQWTIRGEQLETIVLERSENGRQFSPIYSTAASANGFFNDAPSASRLYYRLKVSDAAGDVRFSNVAWVNREEKNTAVVYPTVFQHAISVQYNGAEGGLFKIFSPLGVLLKQQRLQSGTNTVETGALSSSVYFYQVERDGKAVAAGRIIKL